MKIVVIGAGIIGISSAYNIKVHYPEVDVTVIAETFSPNTTSDGAAGYVIPLNDKGTPQETLNTLAKTTLLYVNKLLSSFDQAANIGLSTVHGYLMFEEDVSECSDWSDVVFNYHIVRKEELIGRFPEKVKSVHCFSTVCIESSMYIPWLTKEFQNLGGIIQNKKITNVEELFCDFDLVVNCAGLGAKLLFGDNKLFPIRGQVIRVKAPWVKEFYCYYETDACYLVLPNQNSVLLGGTYEEENYNTSVDKNTKEIILKKTEALIPSLKHAEYLEDWVGLRPGRKGIRVEIEEYKDGKNVIHNYGHSASGITLHWGCAEVVVKLVGQCLLGTK